MTTVLLMLGALLALTLSAVSSGAETGVYCLNRVRLRVRADRREPGAVRLAKLMERSEDLVITTLAGTNVADYLATAFVTALLLHLGTAETHSEIYATALLTPMVLVFGGILPKDLFQREADRLMPMLATPLAVARGALSAIGLLAMLRGVTHVLLRLIDPQHLPRESELLPRARIRRLLIEGAASGGLSEFQREILDRILRMSQTRVSDIMVRRERAAIVPIDMPREDLLRIARMAHFSRLPVHRGDPRRIIGIINVYDVLSDDRERPIAQYVREALFVPADAAAPDALRRLQQARQVMGIAVNQRGECVGLFTMKNLIECIVGEVPVW
ncbi:MAG: DUF21 domain-containing protein [Planctomycetota bacterium]|nr:MAG: DUF21 domain-containing protein [Planctomycetota bacterium]